MVFGTLKGKGSQQVHKEMRFVCTYKYKGSLTGPAKWISKWRGHGTLTSIFGHHGWPTRKVFEF